MGYGYTIKCRECDYEKIVSLGRGFVLSYYPEGCQHFIESESTLKHIEMLINEKGGQVLGSSLELYYCPQCHQFKVRVPYKVVYDGGVFEPQYQCSKCTTALDHIPSTCEEGAFNGIDLTKYQCPKCGKHSLT